ncbi:Gfo/Idh/MocA family oxidoreductase [Phragmitibacter flavus]|uniref:Gfo/Idh/MocA family oxidoreductase n=1 Tax=Phragmitibacter flavus TaxID=2576071 RepID=A0A5R8KAJ4_9BACT|nr:Gfo/Idh/MocA family oxidoreductase [Phragmitibacter flavus]TLD69326.1 Gfo/Idh/MocA family oxidoreductase [Phragmitibacter flavus]
MNRRRFLKHAAASTATASIGFPAITSVAAPNSQINIACIGVGGMGKGTISSIASHPKAKIVALCDVDKNLLQKTAATYPDASQHLDWRELLADHSSKFDAITIATPDHMHATPCVLAIRAKKHIYLQKPMAPTVHECRVIVAEAEKAGVITQMGNQGRSSIESRMMVQLLQTGAIGKIKEIILWENKPLSWWPTNTTLTPQGDTPPDTLDWDKWLGVRDSVPFLNGAYHPQHWRAWRDYGVGELGDMGCHHFDATVDALQLSPALRVKQTHTGETGTGLWSKAREVEFEFAGTSFTAGDTLKLTWLDGEHHPDASKIPMPKALTKFPLQGGLWIGDKGSIFKPYNQRPFVLPEENFPNEKYPRNFPKQDHYHDWVDAIINNRPATSHFKHAANLTEVVLVGTLAEHAPNEWVTWDAKTQQTNHDTINANLIRPYREGWKVEGLG